MIYNTSVTLMRLCLDGTTMFLILEISMYWYKFIFEQILLTTLVVITKKNNEQMA